MLEEHSLPRTIVIFCRNFREDKKPFSSNYYWHAYLDLFFALKAKGNDTYFATSNDTYKQNGMFSVAYTADRKVPISQFRTVHNIIADIIYDKGGFIRSDNVPVLNPAFVHTITAHKAKTYKHFGAYQPITIICKDEPQLRDAIQTLPGSLAVLKKLTGNGGHGVYIGTKQEMLQKAPVHYPVLVQEFIDTTVGINVLAQGRHDLRIKIGGGEVWGGTLRVPSSGEYRANVAQGGSERHLFPEEIPKEAKQMALKIDQYFASYPRYYAVDLANTTKGWKLIELNSKPGLSPIYFSPQAKDITERLATYLTSLG